MRQTRRRRRRKEQWPMRKTIVVALREYQSAVKTKAFLIGLLMMPLMFGGGILVQVLLRNNADTRDKRVAIADYTGQLFDAISVAANVRNQVAIYEGEGEARKQVRPRFVVEQVEVSTDDPARMALKLSDRVRKKEILAFVIIERNALESGGAPGQPIINYHSESPTYDQIQQWVSGPINERIQQLRLQTAHLDAKVVRAATQRVAVGNVGLVS